jgi:predicted nucleic acid-binding protein
VPAYVDTSLLAKLYVPEADSNAAVALIKKIRSPISVSALHKTELQCALQLKVFRGEIDAARCAAAYGQFLTDIEDGVWAEAPPVLEMATHTAERLAREHSAKLGTRSLDVLHVAVAVELGSTVFATNDTRQAALAKASGMTVKAL